MYTQTDTGKLNIGAEELSDLVRMTRSCMESLSEVREHLRRYPEYRQVGQTLDRISNSLENHSQSIRNLSAGLERIAAVYDQTEQSIVEEMDVSFPAYEPVNTSFISLEKESDRLFNIIGGRKK